ncbi:MAG: thioredoxin family protein [Butyricimonas paravirosa]
MKKCILVLAIVLSSVAPFAQGVNFQELTLKEACAKAKAENKLVFIDCYTDWCGPCRLMTEEIFPMKEMGDYFNPKYICIKANAEKGEEGPAIKEKFGIKGTRHLSFSTTMAT